MKIVTEIGRWRVTLRDATVVDVWADGYEEAEGFYAFGVLVSSQNEPEGVVILNRAPADPRRFVVAVARFPAAAVAEIIGG